MVDEATFFRYVREVFARLDDRPYLRAHPLTSLLAGRGHTASAEALRGVLLSAVEELQPLKGTPPGSATWRHWRCLSLRYVDGLNTKQIARQLLISERQAQRDHLAGVDAAATVLWASYRKQAGAVGRPADPEPASVGTALRAAGSTGQDDLEVELARVSALSAAVPTGLVETLESALTTIRGLAEAHQAHLEVSFPNDLCPVAVNQVVLRQIVLCLLTCALRGEPGPQISLSAANVAGYVELRLTVQRPRGRQPNVGSALAEAAMLADTARRLAEAEGGALEVEQATGRPTRLTLKLPATRVATVLVVDDNPDIVQLFRRYLAGSHYRLVQARTPHTALELAQELHPDVITLDVLMPSRDGWQILQQLRSDPAVRDIPVIVCSILPERPLALSLGVADFLAKPVTPQSLLAALERCLGAQHPA